MGLIDNLLGKKEETNKGGVPFTLKLRFNPIRLSRNKNNSLTLYITLENITDESILTSVAVKVPKGLGVDQTGLHAMRELRLDQLPPKTKKELNVDVYANTGTGAGEYDVTVTAYSHYRDYTHFLNSVSQTLALRVVE